MHICNLPKWQHEHRFHRTDSQGERNAMRVILLTVSMMVIEIVAGLLCGSIALLADALTSLLAIVALTAGKFLGWLWMDPVMGIVGALVISKWSYGLLRETSTILLDRVANQDIVAAIKSAIEADAYNRVADIHVWTVASQQMSVILAIVTHFPKNPQHYKALLTNFKNLAHITVEINQSMDDPCLV